MHLPVGETNANHLLSYQLAIQHLAKKEPVSDAGVCYSSKDDNQTIFCLFYSVHEQILSFSSNIKSHCNDKSYNGIVFIFTRLPSLCFKFIHFSNQNHYIQVLATFQVEKALLCWLHIM